MVGAVTARDRDGNELTYSLASEREDHEAFAIGAGGEIRVAAGVTLDHEVQASYVFMAQVSDGEDAAGREEDSPTVDDMIAVTVEVENVEEPPGPPTELTVRDAGKFGLEADWTAPAERGAGLDGYAVQFRLSGSEAWTDHAHAGTATATTIGGLTPDTRYELRVRSLGDGDSAWTAAEAYTAPLDDAAAREHLFPLFADGDGFHSHLYLTGVSGPDNRCTLQLHGPGLDAVRFESHAAPASGAEIAPGASSVALKTAGAEALAFGYAKLSCTEPAAARLLLSWEDRGAPAAMTNLESVLPAREFRFPILSRLGLVFSNDNQQAAACAAEVESANGESVGGGTIAVPAGATEFRYLDELAALEEEVDGGAVSVTCDRAVAALGVALEGGVFAALAAVGPEDRDASRSRQVLPLVLDGGGFRSRLLLTNLSDEVNWCEIDLRGAGMTAARFASAADALQTGSGIYPRLAAAGGRISLSSLGRDALAFGHAVVECDEPVDARNMITVHAPNGLAGMAEVTPVQPAREARFPVAPGLGLGLALTNAGASDASCQAELALTEREETLTAAAPLRVAAESTAVRFLADLFALPDDFAGGEAKLSCNRDIEAIALIHAEESLNAGLDSEFPDALPFAAMPPVVTASDSRP